MVINLASTEHFSEAAFEKFVSIDDFEAALDENSPEISPAMLYAYASIAAGVPYGNFTPSVAADLPALIELGVSERCSCRRKRWENRTNLLKDGTCTRVEVASLERWTAGIPRISLETEMDSLFRMRVPWSLRLRLKRQYSILSLDTKLMIISSISVITSQEGIPRKPGTTSMSKDFLGRNAGKSELSLQGFNTGGSARDRNCTLSPSCVRARKSGRPRTTFGLF